MPRRPAAQDPRRTLPAAGGAMPWRKAAMRAAGALLLLSGWLALSWELHAFLEARRERGDLTDGILWTYLKRWREFTWLGALWCVAVWSAGPLWRAMQAPRFSDGVVGTATPGALGAIRVLTCSILLLLTLMEDLAGTALLPRTMLDPQGVMELLHLLPIGFDAFLADEAALRAFQCFTALLLALGVLGLGTRVVVPAAAVCYLVLGGVHRGYSFFNHSGIIPLYVLAVLSFTRCGQGWSLDRVLRAARGKSVAPARTATAYFGWARHAVWTAIAVAYVSGGASKLYYMGPGWASADSMRWVWLRPTMELSEAGHGSGAAFWLVPAPDALLVSMAAFVLGLQLSFGLVLVSRRARLILPAAVVGFHIGSFFLMNILFIDLLLLPWVFYDWSPLGRRLGRWRGGAGRCKVDEAPARDAAADRPAGTHRLGALAVMAIVLFQASWWATKYTYYPLTPVAMFTQHEEESSAGVVSYVLAVAHYEDGSSGPAPFRRWNGAMQGGRWRGHAKDAFRDAEGLEKAKRFLGAMILAADTQGDGPRVGSIELQLWQWSFRDDPGNPDRAVLVDRYVHDAD